MQDPNEPDDSAWAPPRRAPRILVAGAVLGQPMGGVHRHAKELLPRVAARLEAAGGGLSILAGRAGLESLELPPSLPQIPSPVPAAPGPRALAESRALRAALASAPEPFDFVHSAHLPAPRRLGVPRTHTLHDLRGLDPQLSGPARRWLVRHLLRTALGNAAHIFTVSEYVRGQITQALGLPRERISVLGNGVDHLTYLPRRAVPDRGLLCVGHVEPRKNQELLVRLLAERPDLPDVWFVGAAKGESQQRLEHLALTLGVSARIHWMGPVSDQQLTELYSRCACVVLPSLEEGFGIPAVEAQFAGCPLAVARAGALTEVAGGATPNFAPQDVAECAGAVRAALASTAQDLARAREHAERFRWDSLADTWCAAWCSLPRTPARG